jgi:hypothetical protein
MENMTVARQTVAQRRRKECNPNSLKIREHPFRTSTIIIDRPALSFGMLSAEFSIGSWPGLQ